MKIFLALLVGVAACVAIYLFLRSRQHTPLSDVFISTATETTARAARLLPMRGSEDRSDLLQMPDLPKEPASSGNYQPNTNVDWVVTITFSKPTKVERSVLLGGFSREWIQANGNPELYGKAATDGRWTYVRAGGAPELFTELAFAWRLVKESERSVQPVSVTELTSYLAALEKHVSVLGDVFVKTSASPESAALAAQNLCELKDKCGHDAVIVLVAPPGQPFDGCKIWDVMMSVGLKWGDMDIFHWVNDSESGDDTFFSVWTSTAPGYFLPEQIAADRVRVANLVFGFSIPRCAAPQAVFTSMAKVAEYAQQRLGGELRGDAGPLDASATLEQIRAIERRLDAAGFKPGAGSTLYIF